MVSRLSVCLLLVVLSGCTVTSLGEVNSTYIKQFADINAIAYTCAEHGLMPKLEAQEVGFITTRVLGFYDYDEDLYAGPYIEMRSALGNETEEQISYTCAQLKYTKDTILQKSQAQYVANVKSLNQKQINRDAGWARLLGQAADTAQSLGTDAQALGTNTYTDTMSDQPSFGLPDNQTNHYLINTDSGLTQCHVTPSGYTFCN